MGLASEKWGEGLGRINEIIAKTLMVIINDPIQAVHHADQITLRITQEYGGDQLYIPKAEAFANHYRDQAISAQFNGSNARELAQKYHLTTRHIRRVIKK